MLCLSFFMVKKMLGNWAIIVDSMITWTLSIGVVRNADRNPPLSPLIRGVGEYAAKPHLPGVESVYLFLEFTIKPNLSLLYIPRPKVSVVPLQFWLNFHMCIHVFQIDLFSCWFFSLL